MEIRSRLNRTCGIYCILNKKTNIVYVGKSVNINRRFTDHKKLLKCGKHYNDYLQNSYNKHGKNIFEFDILENCDKIYLPIKEQYWIDTFFPNIYNIKKYVLSETNENNNFFGKKHTEETKKKMSEAKKDKYFGENNPNYGKKQTSETRKKISINRSGKLNEKIISEIIIFIKNGYSHQKIADMFNIGRTTVTRISNGTRWTNITKGPVIPIVYVEGKRQFEETHKKRISESKRRKK